MPAIATLHDLMVHQLQDLYSAERQLVKALPRLSKKSKTPELREAIDQHLAQTQEQVSRLETVFEILGENPKGVTCKGMQGLIAETEELFDEDIDGAVLDAGIIADAQRVEHYEISAYGTACEYARSMGHDRIAELLTQTLEEEKEADKLLSGIAESGINQLAMRDGQQDMGRQDEARMKARAR